ncbi:unnamed protein product [Clonostachys rhizophaga]|uniref:Xylanolytic transcriptional activator regulatory domain-containing protein n=1 Tax=Clonostachys rhizophaga TaxID=160324 RepID=A0A9N9VN45_9HYPO|nr:unnamed protein product [Clonostachys rhizophaga]
MDPAHVFRQGLGSVAPRQWKANHIFSRQRKTRCDPTLPRCLPCERSGSTCEYLDTAKGRKINRFYVIKLQDKVRALEAELDQYVDDEADYPHSSEDMVRPGGMVRLGSGDETPRYLGPSSGIAMTRLLMEEAKRFTESNRISELIPELKKRREARMQSIQMTGPVGRQRSFPKTSQLPAENLPGRPIANRLVEIFNQKSQIFWPVVHEPTFQKDLDAVYNGDTDVYKLFVVRIVLAISLQKLGDQYAGLADSYYLAAMQDFETVLRPKDLKTLQCLVLIGLYSILTPTRVPVYFVIGLAAKICQQEGLVSEKTIAAGDKPNPLTIDMRRRLVWVVASMEFGLAHSLGRPNSFATADEQLDVGFFSTVEDDYITENGIDANAPTSDRKLIAIHFYRMRILQAEIRRTLYERKRPEPKDDTSHWFQHMEQKITDWQDSAPENPEWCRKWFAGRCHQMRISMYRPSPQISKPSAKAALICYESTKIIIDLSRQQVEANVVDITWVFILVLNMALNTLLWTTSYEEVRQDHPREEVEELVNGSLDVLDRCAERWPGTGSSSQLYAVFSKACLQSYESKGYQQRTLATPPAAASEAARSPDYQYQMHENTPQQPMYANPPQFGQVFDSPPESIDRYDPSFRPPHPTFRSNSIFQNPGTHDTHGRRFSYFPPDFMQSDDLAAPDEETPPNTTPTPNFTTSPPSQASPSRQLPTPPESLGNMSMATPTMSTPAMLPIQAQTPNSMGMAAFGTPTPELNSRPQTSPLPPYGMTPVAQHTPVQRPLPQELPSSSEWFTPPASFMNPYNFGTMGGGFYGSGLPASGQYQEFSGAGLGLQAMNFGADGSQFSPVAVRQDSLTQSQQLELMNVLETEGVRDIDTFLTSGTMVATKWY